MPYSFLLNRKRGNYTMEDVIQLKKDNILRVKIKDQNGNMTDGILEFDLEDIELPLKYQECLEQHKKNISYIKNQFIIIDKREDVKGKKLLSKNEEDKIKLLNEFYDREMKSMDLFLGEGKSKMFLKLMNRNPYWSMFDDIAEVIEPISPKLKLNLDNIDKKIKEKYSSKENNVLKDE